MRRYFEENILPRVAKPTRYLDREVNAIHKPWEEAAVRMAFAFPDVYEVGMSHLGLGIIYGLVNERPGMLLERVFAPWVDMEDLLRKEGLPLFTLESGHPLKDFDVVGFSLQYELSYTNILNMLDLGRIPLLAAERGDDAPLIIGGGPNAFNPEPLADYFDLFLLGDAEEALPEILETVGAARKNHTGTGSGTAGSGRAGGGKFDRRELLAGVAGIRGVYIPSYYEASYDADGRVREVRPTNDRVPKRVRKRVVADLDRAYFPTRPIVPYMEVIHDRAMLEVLRGCTRGCRFCQAGTIYRPVRERTPETLLRQAREIIQHTGHQEISLTSLSTADYTCVDQVLKTLVEAYKEEGVGVSLPSLRADAFSVDLARTVQEVRKTGLTFAPEAGSQRLRDVINKGVTENDLMEAVGAAFQAGWNSVKLYFMIGLPTETNEDLVAISELVRRVLELELPSGTGAAGGGRGPESGQKRLPGARRKRQVTVSISSFVPKAHTPFQWEPQDSIQVLETKQVRLRELMRRDRRITFRWHEARASFLEGVFARGDRRLGRVLLEAWRRGARFDSWTEMFNLETWLTAFKNCGLDPIFYANRRRDYDEIFPWEHLDAGMTRRFLLQEHIKAMTSILTPDCRWERCPGCGVCHRFGVDTELAAGRPAGRRYRSGRG